MLASEPLFVIFFMAGAFLFLIGIALRLFFYSRGQWDLLALAKGVFSTLFSWRILTFVKIFFCEGILQRTLFGQDKLRWLMKFLIMVGYPSILIAGHLKVEMMDQFRTLPHLLKFFYAPFCDFYYFRDFVGTSIGLADAVFAVCFDLFGAMILAGEFIAIYRRFVVKASPFKTSIGDLLAVNLLGGWFVLRFFCEATSILAYSIPDPVARYWFVSFGLSKVMAPLGLPWSVLNEPLWSVSGFFLASLVASIPFNTKLWHIVTIPVGMFLRLMPREAFQPGSRKRSLVVSVKDLLALDACVKCGSCVEVCPVYSQIHQLETTMGGFFSNLKSLLRKNYGFPGATGVNRDDQASLLKEYSGHSYLCTLCGRCETVCPALIETKELRIAGRELMVDKGEYPVSLNRLAQTLESTHNILGEPNQNRAMWLQDLPRSPKHLQQKKSIRTIYFVGCVASYFPTTKKIAQSLVQLLDRAGLDFAILGGEEWCCGFPLIGAGMREKAKAFMQHNVDRVKEMGAETVIFSCPSCYHTWMEENDRGPKIFHSTQFIKKLIDEGKIEFREQAIKVTYHDPCDLGRAGGIYEVPREILRAIPGVELVEMEKNREKCTCCGGGGNLEMVNPELSAAMAKAKIDEILKTGATTVISACQQCVRTILSAARKNKIRINVADLTDFVLKCTKENTEG